MSYYLAELLRSEKNSLRRLVRLYKRGKMEAKGCADLEWLATFDPMARSLIAGGRRKSKMDSPEKKCPVEALFDGVGL